MRKKAKQLGFVDGILFSQKRNRGKKEPDKDEPEEEPDEKQKPKKSTGIYAIFHISDQCIFAAENICSNANRCTDQSA